MKKELVVSLHGEEIDAVNAASLAGKLCQMANGAVYGEEHKVIPLHDRKLDMLIHDLSTGLIGREEFLYAKEKYRAELNRILAAEAAQKERIEQMQKGLSTTQAWVRAMREYQRLPAITRELLDTLVERISIHEDRSITIQLNYADPFAALRSYHTLTEEAAYCG